MKPLKRSGFTHKLWSKRPAAAAVPKQPSPGGFATPIPTDLGAFFPRPKRGRSAEQKPLVPRTEF